MGTGASTELVKKNKVIDQSIQSEKKTLTLHVKLLLLGTGESGKSTLAKQMKVLKLNGFTDAERDYFKRHIQRNVARAVVDLWQELLDRKLAYVYDTEAYVHTVSHWLKNITLSQEAVSPLVVTAMQKILADHNISPFVKNQGPNLHQLQDNAFYFMQNLERVSDDDYSPTAEDIVRCRIQTTSIEELTFLVKGFTVHLIDVGGQKGQRKKWITQFDGVKGVIFVTALCDYYKRMEEDPETNRMVDSVQVFRDVVRHQCFRDSSVLIFFNKKDIMSEVLPTVLFSHYFNGYVGQNDYESVTKHIESMFLAAAPDGKKVYSHFTNATDKANIDKVFQMTLSLIIDQNLQGTGLG